MSRVLLGVLLLALWGCPEGPPGPEGPRGEQGERGPPGEPGAGGLDVAESTLCQKLQGGWAFAIQVVEFTSGDVLVTCSVSDPQSVSSRTFFYDSEQVGAEVHGCSVTMDADQDGTAGWWAFARDTTGEYFAAYNDDQSTIDGELVAFDGADSTSGGCDVYAD